MNKLKLFIVFFPILSLLADRAEKIDLLTDIICSMEVVVKNKDQTIQKTVENSNLCFEDKMTLLQIISQKFESNFFHEIKNSLIEILDKAIKSEEELDYYLNNVNREQMLKEIENKYQILEKYQVLLKIFTQAYIKLYREFNKGDLKQKEIIKQQKAIDFFGQIAAAFILR